MKIRLKNHGLSISNFNMDNERQYHFKHNASKVVLVKLIVVVVKFNSQCKRTCS